MEDKVFKICQCIDIFWSLGSLYIGGTLIISKFKTPGIAEKSIQKVAELNCNTWPENIFQRPKRIKIM